MTSLEETFAPDEVQQQKWEEKDKKKTEKKKTPPRNVFNMNLGLCQRGQPRKSGPSTWQGNPVTLSTGWKGMALNTCQAFRARHGADLLRERTYTPPRSHPGRKSRCETFSHIASPKEDSPSEDRSALLTWQGDLKKSVAPFTVYVHIAGLMAF